MMTSREWSCRMFVRASAWLASCWSRKDTHRDAIKPSRMVGRTGSAITCPPSSFLGMDLPSDNRLALSCGRIASRLPRTSRKFPSLFFRQSGIAPPRHPSSTPERRRAAVSLRRVVLNRGVVWPNLPTVSVHSRYELLGAVRAALCMSLLSMDRRRMAMNAVARVTRSAGYSSGCTCAV
jgi:hypothetical protein